MDFNIRGENFELTPAIKEYVIQKVSKIQKYFTNNLSATANVNLKVYKSGQKAEVTINSSSVVLRAEEKNNDIYAAVDLVVDKLERQIRKHKTKVNRKQRERGFKQDFFHSTPYDSDTDVDLETDEEEFEVKRYKKVELLPMDMQEAILQMNMLGHDFFMFIEGTTGKTCVVYKRTKDTYGLIETL